MAMVGIRFDLRVPSFATTTHAAMYQACLDQCEWADRLGLDIVVLSEHHGVDDGFMSAPVTIAAAVAGRTKRIQINIAAILVPLHDPVRLAEQLAAVSLVSGGRVGFVAGLGYRQEEFEMAGVERRQRGKLLEEYVEVMRTRNLELAAEYLVMAAMLMEIKSRLLLPRPAAVGEGERDPRAELVRRLIEYEKMKLAGQRLEAMPQLGRDFLPVEVWIEQTFAQRLPQVNVVDLQEAWRALLLRAKMTQHHRVSREELSVREHMSLILRRLRGGGFAEFGELFEMARGVPVLIVNFLAVLELVRENLLEVTQSEPYAPIYVKLAHAQSE